MGYFTFLLTICMLVPRILGDCGEQEIAHSLQETRSQLPGFEHKRELMGCYAHLTCSDCIGDTVEDCAWLNEACEDNPHDNILYDWTYDEGYCQNANYDNSSYYTSTSMIELGELPGEQIEMLMENAQEAFDNGYPTCEWILETDPDLNITIQITRNVENKEDIYILLSDTIDETAGTGPPAMNTSSGNTQYLSGKNITDCTNNTFEYTYTNISQITVKTQIRVGDSSFYIFIYQSGIDLSSNKVVQRSRQILEILAISIIACFGFLILTIFIFAICKKKVFAKSKKTRYGKKVELIKSSAKERIAMTMQCMSSGLYAQKCSGSKYTLCVICFKHFDKSDHVHITNECAHVFHSDCLEKWYKLLSQNIVLACAYCNKSNYVYDDRIKSGNSTPLRTGTPLAGDLSVEQELSIESSQMVHGDKIQIEFK